MSGLADPHGSARWATLAALVLLVAGIGLAARQWMQGTRARSPALMPEGRSSAPAESASDRLTEPAHSMDERAIEQALRLTPGFEDKSRWVEEVPGVDVSDLDARRRELFIRFANAERCTCGCGYTLAACRAYDPTCDVSLPMVRALLDSVRGGLIASATGIRRRPAERR